MIDDQEVVADFDDVLGRLLDPLPDAVGPGADLFSDFRL
jgi:hypothetical protein